MKRTLIEKIKDTLFDKNQFKRVQNKLKEIDEKIELIPYSDKAYQGRGCSGWNGYIGETHLFSIEILSENHLDLMFRADYEEINQQKIREIVKNENA